MQQTLPFKIWRILYPLGMYYVVASVMMVLGQLIFGADDASYMYSQIFSSVITIPVIYQYYRQDRFMEGIPAKALREIRIEKEQVIHTVWIVFIAGCVGISLNNLIQMSPLVQMSAGFVEASNAFYGSTILVELIGSALITPLLEELLYRGLIYGRLRKMMGCIPSVLISSFIFAFMHFNIVQFIYALLLGIVLALCMEKAGHMYGAVIGHITANAIAVLRTETGILNNTADGSTFAWIVSSVVLVIGLVLLVCYMRRGNDN